MKSLTNKLKQTLGSIEKQFGQGAMMLLGERPAVTVPCISSGCASLDKALGIGGYPRGRITEIYGPESSGKTTLTLHAIAACQQAGGIAAFIDAEHALDTQYAEALGVNLQQLLVSQPDTGEQALDIVDALVRTESVDLIVVDSVAALVPKAEIEGEMGDTHVGLQARLMSRALRKLTGNAFRSSTALMFINQLRMKVGVTYGSPEVTTGGHALKYYASMRLDVRRIGPVKAGDQVIGNRTRVRVVKNKLAPPFRDVEFDIRYGHGMDQIGDMIDVLVHMECIEKRGSHYHFEEVHLGQGREKVRERLLQDAALMERAKTRLATAQATESAAAQSAKAAAAAARNKANETPTEAVHAA